MKKRLLFVTKYLLPISYIIAAVLWLCGGVFGFAFDRAHGPVSLALEDASIYGLTSAVPIGEDGPQDAWEQWELMFAPLPQSIVSTDADPYIIFTFSQQNIRTLHMDAQFATPPGEVILYYSYPENTNLSDPTAAAVELGFSQNRRVNGEVQADGSYIFTLPAGEIAALRLDPGNVPGNEIFLNQLTLNVYSEPHEYFLPNARQWLMLAILPAFVCCVIYTIAELLSALKRLAVSLRKVDKQR